MSVSAINAIDFSLIVEDNSNDAEAGMGAMIGQQELELLRRRADWRSRSGRRNGRESLACLAR